MLGPKMGPTFLNGHTLNNVSALPTALTAFRVWPIKNVGAIFGHASAAAYAQRSG